MCTSWRSFVLCITANADTECGELDLNACSEAIRLGSTISPVASAVRTLHLVPRASLRRCREAARSIQNVRPTRAIAPFDRLHRQRFRTLQARPQAYSAAYTMEVGEHCAFSSCGRLSFLPVSCPLCTTTFCESHFLPEQHRCSKASSLSKVLNDEELLSRIASTGSAGRLPCQKQGCKKLSFEVQNLPTNESTYATPASSQTGVKQAAPRRAFTHAAPRCERCKGLFCASHRSTTSHGCTAPAPITEGQLKLKAIEDRKKKAAAVLAKHFPNRKT